jgi:hypothetical protein
MSTIPAPPVYQNPFMAPNNISEIHFNSSQTDTTTLPGPASFAHQKVQQGRISPIGRIAGSIAVDAAGQLVTIRVGPTLISRGQKEAQTLLLIDPKTLHVLASKRLPPKPQSGGSGTTFGGGGYFYLNNQNQVVLVTTTQQIRIYSIVHSGSHYRFKLAQHYPISLAGKDDLPNSILPDSSGNLWFISHDGVVGYINTTTKAHYETNIREVKGADPNETISKSFATDGQGRVFVVSDYALYCFQAMPGGGIEPVWRKMYDRGSTMKPGQIQIGSGTTPTCFDDSAGNQFVAIADNANDYMHVNVYNRATGALVAQQEVFTNLPKGMGDTENSLIAVNDSIIVENNYGNATPASTLGSKTTLPDIDRVDFSPYTGQSLVYWQNSTISVPSVVSQLSTADGLLYTYAKDASGWYWAALSYQTGNIVATGRVPWSNRALGAPANNYYGGIMIGPDGTAYEGVFSGIVAWRPRPS